MAHLRYAIENDLATVILNNPPQNRLSAEMLDELAHGLDGISQSTARALLLRADGPDFSCGGDIVPWPEASISQLRTLFERYMSVFNQFERLAMPTVAVVQGRCLGGGLELAVRAGGVFSRPVPPFGPPGKTPCIVTLLGGGFPIPCGAGPSPGPRLRVPPRPSPAP